jgi:molybdopterin biosynthesis enzyme MoaB
MNTFYRIILMVCMISVSYTSWGDPVPLPCEPHCTVDPCKLAPERCKDQGGPIGAKEKIVTDSSYQKTEHMEKKTTDNCDYCVCNGGTVKPACTACCK